MRPTLIAVFFCLLTMACSNETKQNKSDVKQVQRIEKWYSDYPNGKFKQRIKVVFNSMDSLNAWDIFNIITNSDITHRRFDFDTIYSTDSIVVTEREERDHRFLFAQHKRLGIYMIRSGHPKPNDYIFADSLDGMDHKSLIQLRKKTIRELDDIFNDFLNQNGSLEFKYQTDSFDF